MRNFISSYLATKRAMTDSWWPWEKSIRTTTSGLSFYSYPTEGDVELCQLVFLLTACLFLVFFSRLFLLFFSFFYSPPGIICLQRYKKRRVFGPDFSDSRVSILQRERVWLVWFGLVSLFNGISTFVGYLMPTLFS